MTTSLENMEKSENLMDVRDMAKKCWNNLAVSCTSAKTFKNNNTHVAYVRTCGQRTEKDSQNKVIIHTSVP